MSGFLFAYAQPEDEWSLARAPLAPEHVVVKFVKSGSEMVPTLTWTDVSNNEDTFSIERKVSSSSDDSFVYVGTVPMNSTSFIDTSAGDFLSMNQLSKDTFFAYRVTASNRYGSSSSNKAVILASSLVSGDVHTSVDSYNKVTSLVKYAYTKVSNVNTAIQQTGGQVVATLLNTAKASASSGNCVDLTRNFHRGDESSLTSKLQSFLVSKGFLKTDPSGFYGDLTVEAVKAYQRSLGLKETGMVFDFTREAIKKETCN